MKLGPIYPLFFLSGMSGLIYEVIWIRQFGNIFGNTIFSSALVTAVFMCGLGVGGYWAGHWVDRTRKSPRELIATYGRFEAGIAALGVIAVLALGNAEAISPRFSAYSQDAMGWHFLSAGSYAWRYLFAVTLLTPITFLMGGTLILLIRCSVGTEIESSGSTIGKLYGVNTAGAAFGALLVDTFLIPRIGLFASQILAVGLNLFASAGSFALARDAPRKSPVAAMHEASSGTSSRSPVVWMSIGIFISGMVGMGVEMFWIRFLGSVLGPNRVIVSMTLWVVLLGIWIGAIGGGAVHRRWGRPARFFALFQILLAVSFLGSIMVYAPGLREPDLLKALSLQAPSWLRPFVGASAQLWIILLVTLVPAMSLGFSFPLANAHLQRLEAEVGRRAGKLYLANTLGAVTGSLATGFLFLPVFGMQATAVMLAAFASLSCVPILLSDEATNWKNPLQLVSLLLAFAPALGFAALGPSYVLSKIVTRRDPGEKIIRLSEGLNEVLTITELKKPTGVSRILYTDGHLMSGTVPGPVRYMRAFVHLPLLQLEKPSDVLIICFGAGNTAHAASLYPSVTNIEIADLSRNILSHADDFEAWNHGVLRDPRVRVFVNDGRHHLRMQASGKYDLITLEPPPITFAGVASLYSTEFFRLAGEKLKDGGFLTQWLPLSQVPGEISSAMVASFVEAFPSSVVLSGFKDHLILLARKGNSVEINPIALQARITALPEVEKDLARIRMGTLTELIGTFAGGRAAIAKATRRGGQVTDNFPVLEYSPVIFQNFELPKDLFDVSEVGQWCPKCFGPKGPIQGLETLEGFLAIMTAYYQSQSFLKVNNLNPPPHLGLKFPDDKKRAIRAAIQASPYLKELF